jgi:hypothetical protein
MTQPQSLQVFEQHYHRALLQKLAIDINLFPNLENSRSIVVGHLRKSTKREGWLVYAGDVFRKWGLNELTDDVLLGYDRFYRKRAKEVSIFWTLRALLAASIESLILLDRVCSLYELNHREAPGKRLITRLVPIFDPVISPRNFCLVVQKES